MADVITKAEHNAALAASRARSLAESAKDTAKETVKKVAANASAMVTEIAVFGGIGGAVGSATGPQLLGRKRVGEYGEDKLGLDIVPAAVAAVEVAAGLAAGGSVGVGLIMAGVNTAVSAASTVARMKSAGLYDTFRLLTKGKK